MAEIVWIVVIPIVIVGAGLLWRLSRWIPGWGMILVGIAISSFGKCLAPAFPEVADGNTGQRFGSCFQRAMPDLVFLLQILGTIAVVHGIVMWIKRGRKARQRSAAPLPPAPRTEPSEDAR